MINCPSWINKYLGGIKRFHQPPTTDIQRASQTLMGTRKTAWFGYVESSHLFIANPCRSFRCRWLRMRTYGVLERKLDSSHRAISYLLRFPSSSPVSSDWINWYVEIGSDNNKGGTTIANLGLLIYLWIWHLHKLTFSDPSGSSISPGLSLPVVLFPH